MATRRKVLEGIKLEHGNRIKIDNCAIYRLRGMLYVFNWRKWIFDIRDLYSVMGIEQHTETQLMAMPSTTRYETQILPITWTLEDEKHFIILLFEAIEYGDSNHRLDRKSFYELLKQP